MVDFNKVYLSPHEKDPVKQDGVIRQIIEYLRSTATGGFYANQAANIVRLADRLFVGEAASKFAGTTASSDIGTSWLSDASTSGGPEFTGVNSRLLVTTSGTTLENEAIAITGAAKGVQPIGVAGVAETSTSQNGNAWAFYGDLTYNPNAAQAYGIELAIKNASGVNSIPYPHAQTGGAYGIWLAGGSDNSYGPASTNPSAAAIVILNNSNTWNAGIVMLETALTDGQAIKLSSVSSHIISWWDSGNNQRGYIKSVQTTNNRSLIFNDSGVSIGQGTAPLGVVDSTGSSNGFTVTAVTSGNTPSISVYGADATIDLSLVTKGSSGLVSFGSFTSSTTTQVGYITVKDSAGNVRKLMVGN